MNVTVHQAGIQQFDADAIVVNLFEGVTSPGGATGAVDRALGGAIGELIAVGDCRGKLGEVAVLYPRGAIPARRVLVVGLGSSASFDPEAARRAAAAAARTAQRLGVRHLATITHGSGVGGLEPETAAQATVEGSLLALYRYRGLRRKRDDAGDDAGDDAHADAGNLETLTVVEFDAARLPAIERGARIAEIYAAGVRLTRDLVNMPPNIATPSRLAAEARALAERHGLQLTVGDRAWMREHEMGALLAVAQAAGEEPAFIVLEYAPARESADEDPGEKPATVVLVGKGVTFDSGGLTMKTAAGMATMKSDMAGAAAVLGAMEVVARLELPLRVVGIAPCTENMLDANAYRPSDVITAGNGATIEIISTDAEGRLILADALVYAQRLQPDAVIDLATLTGSCVVALGKGVAAGLFTNDEALQEKLLAAAQATHERLWPLPLWDDYRKRIDSKVADLKNSGGRQGGVGTSAAFLQAFTDYPWAHLDIAPMAYGDKDEGYLRPGGSGFGVRLLGELLRHWR